MKRRSFNGKDRFFKLLFFDNLKKFRPAHIHLHLVGVIPVEQLEGRTAIDVSNQAYEMMAKDLGPELVWQEKDEES